jgi:hypothetical protein
MRMEATLMTESLIQLEGTWEDILSHARDLEGKYVRLTATGQAPGERVGLREAMARARKIQASMGTTQAGDTVDTIREGRSGAMYGLGSDA